MFLDVPWSDDSSTRLAVTSCPEAESRRTTGELLTAWFYEVDEPLRALPQPPEAPLGPREGGPLGRLHALKGGGHRPGSRGWTRDARAWLPRLPERPRLLRLCKTPPDGPQLFLAAPTVLGVMDPSGIERIHPRRAGRSPQPSGRTGLATPRWMGGGTRCLLRHHEGVVGAGAGATAKTAETTLPWLLRPWEERRRMLRDMGCQAAEGDPSHLQLGQRGEGEERLGVETGRSRLTLVGHLTPVRQRGWGSFQARLAFTRAAFHGLVQWHGFQPSASGVVPLSMAELSLSNTNITAGSARD
jgi:hypothetical protein